MTTSRSTTVPVAPSVASTTNVGANDANIPSVRTCKTYYFFIGLFAKFLYFLMLCVMYDFFLNLYILEISSNIFIIIIFIFDILFVTHL